MTPLNCQWKKRQIGFIKDDGSFYVTNPNVDIMQDRTGDGCLYPVATNISEDIADHIINLHNQVVPSPCPPAVSVLFVEEA